MDAGSTRRGRANAARGPSGRRISLRRPPGNRSPSVALAAIAVAACRWEKSSPGCSTPIGPHMSGKWPNLPRLPSLVWYVIIGSQIVCDYEHRLSITRRPVSPPTGKTACPAVGWRAPPEDIEFVHRARVATRRLRAALRMFDSCFAAKPGQTLAEGDPAFDPRAGRCPRPRRADRTPLRHAVGAERQGMFSRRCPRAGAIGARP